MNIIQARAEARRRYGLRAFAKKTRQGLFLVGCRVSFPCIGMGSIDDTKGASRLGFAEAFEVADKRAKEKAK